MSVDPPPEEPVKLGVVPELGPPAPAPLPAQVAKLQSEVLELRATVAAILAAAWRPPVHLQVERLHADSLTFQLGDVEVESISGQLNIGINLHAGGAPVGIDPERATDQPERPAGGRQLWPPLTEKTEEKA